MEKDILQAVIWFTQAAEQGNSYAAYALGKLYLTGEDVPKNMEAALRWLQRSAELGNQCAQHYLKRMRDQPSLLSSAARLLHHMGRIFQDQHPHPMSGMGVAVDSKLKRNIREKKIAMGHRPDEHDEQRMGL